MATIAESIRKSSLSLSGINNSLFQTKKSMSAVNGSVNNISRIISTNSRTKRTLYGKSELIKIRRREASKRKEIEDRLESKKVSFNLTRGLAFASRSQGSPLARLVGFLGFITSGWIIENLPTWIFMGKEFVRRVYTVGGSMSNMMGNFKLLFNFFTTTLKNSFDAIVKMDFRQFTEGNVAESFQGMVSTIEKLGENFNDIFSIFRTPLTQSSETGEQAPGLGDARTESMFPGVQQETSGYGTKEQQALLTVIRRAEGTTKSYGTISGGDIVPELAEGKLTVQETINLAQTSKLPARFGGRKVNHVYSGATGAYQFMPKTLQGLVNSGRLNPNELFTPRKQDEAALILAEQRGVSADLLRREGFSKNVSNLLAPEWAAIPTKSGRSYYGQGYVDYSTLRSTYQSSLSQPSSSAPAPGAPPEVVPMMTGGLSGPATFIQGNTGKSSGDHFHIGPDYELYGKPAGYAAARQGAFLIAKNLMARKIPFTFSNWYGFKGWWFSGKDVKSDDELRKAIEKEQIAHTTRRSGSSYAGIDIAAPYGTKIPGIINVQYVANGFGVQGTIAGTKAFVGHGAYGSKSGSSTTTPLGVVTPARQQTLQRPSTPVQQATITSPPSTPSQITPQRQGSQVVILDTSNPTPPAQYISPASQMPIPMTIDEYKLLNNFMKNKLLLDLAYL